MFHPLGPEVSAAWQKFASSSVFFGAAVLCMNRGRSLGAERFGWWLFASALVLWGTASVYYFVLVIPSVADWIWLAGYLPAYAVPVLLLIVLTQAHAPATSGAYIAFPVADLGLLALVVASLTIVGWRSRGIWHWITPALVIFALADSVYLIQVARGTYRIGHIVDLGWPTAALLVGFAAWWPEAPERPATRTWTTIVVPAVSGFTALGLLVAQRFVWLNSLAVGLATASILVILVRLYLTGQDNLRLLADSRREATTDPLTGLGNRRKSTADLTRQLADLDRRRPLILMLLDLNGFKQYNDTFGHPAGDKLLERLGARLRGVVDGRGMAYRMGGDEFCALWRLRLPAWRRS
ncbi:MAG: GGDEF domain-containing protein [Solirubrobacteraceae bacterium]